jgi:hypothetical protein
MTEQGPFRPNEDKTLTLNQFSWNQRANMVFIEAPCGVGFSYSERSHDYSTGDLKTAQDNYQLIQEFLFRFPEYRHSDLYLSSESYGGHYIPTLAKQIVLENKNNVGTDKWLNFKGFAVGNPYTDPYSGFPAMIETFWGHQVISYPAYRDFIENCDITSDDFFDRDDDDFSGRMQSKSRILKKHEESACDVAIDTIMDEVGSLNPYGMTCMLCTLYIIYTFLCSFGLSSL